MSAPHVDAARAALPQSLPPQTIDQLVACACAPMHPMLSISPPAPHIPEPPPSIVCTLSVLTCICTLMGLICCFPYTPPPPHIQYNGSSKCVLPRLLDDANVNGIKSMGSITTPTSSSISLAAAASGVSFISTFPPGNSHMPPHCLWGGRLAISTCPFASTSTTATANTNHTGSATCTLRVLRAFLRRWVDL